MPSTECWPLYLINKPTSFFRSYITVYSRSFIIILLCVGSHCLLAQRSIRGRVLESTEGEPLPAASILLKGTGMQAVTDSTGRFQMIIPGSRGVLVVSFFGYKTREIVLTGKSNYRIQLSPDLSDVESKSDYTAPNDYFQAGLTSGLNYTHYGIVAKAQLRSFMPENPLSASLRYQFFQENNNTQIKFGRANNFSFIAAPITSVLEYSRRKINLGEALQFIEQIGKTHHADTKWGLIGLGVGLQNEQVNGQKRMSFAFIAEWEETIFSSLTANVRVKKWQEASQLEWELNYHLPKPQLNLMLFGIHHDNYHELSLGLTYNFLTF